MSEAPERIWATEDTENGGQDRFHTTRPTKGLTEYVRADMLQEIFARYSKAEVDRIEELEAENANLRSGMHTAINAVTDAARARGEAEGKLAASEIAGVLDGWIEKCAALEAKIDFAVGVLERALRYNTAMHYGAAAFNQYIKDAIAELTGGKDE